jgi:hypothetical protein
MLALKSEKPLFETLFTQVLASESHLSILWAEPLHLDVRVNQEVHTEDPLKGEELCGRGVYQVPLQCGV